MPGRATDSVRSACPMALRFASTPPASMTANVTAASGRLERNAQGRYRIADIDVVVSLAEKLGEMPHQARCLEQFEDFCIVTESVREGIRVDVEVTTPAVVA